MFQGKSKAKPLQFFLKYCKNIYFCFMLQGKYNKKHAHNLISLTQNSETFI